MSLSHSLPKRSNRAIAVVIAMIASLFVLVSPNLESKADYTDSNTGPIVYNDRVCNLGDPNDHTTSATAFEISTSEQLWEITDCVSSSATVHFELGDDIGVSEATTAPTASPIGYSTSGDISFSGVINGGNKVISGISMSTSYGVGLFAYLHNATISNLVISGSFVTTTTTNNISDSAGGLAIRADGTLYLASISNQASVTGKDNVGGLVGYVELDANISSSYNTGSVSGQDDVGGLVGYVNANANISSSYNTGTVSGQQFVGGLVGRVIDNANITSSYNAGPVSGSDRVGGLVGRVDKDANIDSSYNTGPVSGTLGFVGGVVGYVIAQFNITSSYNAGTVTGSPIQDGLAVVNNDTVTTTSAYSSVTSSYVGTTPVDDMKLASTYIGFDFSSANPVWGFGTCSENDSFPMLRAFAQISNYNSVACVDSSPPPQSSPSPGSTPAPTPTPAPVYSGPVISGAPSVVAGAEITLTGSRLESVTTVLVGGVQVSIVSALSQSLTLDIPSSMVPGSYDLVLQSSFGTLTIQNGLTVLAPLDKVDEPATKKLTVGSFKGYIAIYTKGYEGQRLSARVAGRWLVVPEISENWNGNSYSRTVRFTGAGESINVHLYIDREFVKTESISTQ